MWVSTSFCSVGPIKGPVGSTYSDFVPFHVLLVETGYEYMWVWPR